MTKRGTDGLCRCACVLHAHVFVLRVRQTYANLITISDKPKYGLYPHVGLCTYPRARVRFGLTRFARMACGTLRAPRLRASKSDARLRCLSAWIHPQTCKRAHQTRMRTYAQPVSSYDSKRRNAVNKKQDGWLSQGCNSLRTVIAVSQAYNHPVPNTSYPAVVISVIV